MSAALHPIRASLVRVGAERNWHDAIGAGHIWQDCETCHGEGLVARSPDGIVAYLCDDCGGHGGSTIEEERD